MSSSYYQERAASFYSVTENLKKVLAYVHLHAFLIRGDCAPHIWWM